MVSVCLCAVCHEVQSSLLRVIAGLWKPDAGTITVTPDATAVMFTPQRCYMTQGTLRDQLLYPKLLPRLWDSANTPAPAQALDSRQPSSDEETPLLSMSAAQSSTQPSQLPSDGELVLLLRQLQLGHLLRVDAPHDETGHSELQLSIAPALDVVRNWSSELSMGEQQRIAFARLLCHRYHAVF